MRQQLRKRDKGAILVIGTAALVMIVPMIGMAIDTGIVFVTKTKLQSSVDGAALAAARALNLGQTAAQQETSAKLNARNWFDANFGSSFFGSQNTVFAEPIIQDTNLAVRNVTVSATTEVPTYFMKWFGFPNTRLAATGWAQRRDMVMMMVLDRSGSMQANGGCTPMKNAAASFIQKFTPGRDRIGIITFSDTALVIRPVTNFDTVLPPLINAISCVGNTNTSQAVSLGYNELYAQQLPGALNVLMVMTDGLPNSMTMNLIANNQNSFRTDYASSPLTPPSPTIAQVGDCRAGNGTALRSGGNMITNPRRWQPASSAPNFITGPTPPGWETLFVNPMQVTAPIGVIGTGDTSTARIWGMRYFASNTNSQLWTGTFYSNTDAPDCDFGTGGSSGTTDQRAQNNLLNQVDTLPTVDAYGVNVIPGYRPITTVTVSGNTRVALRSLASNQSNLTAQVQNVAFNLSDNAATRARTNNRLPAYVFTIGFTADVDHTLLQRMANDPNGDQFNTPPQYSAIPNIPSQPEGMYVYAPGTAQLGPAFDRIAAMVLRLNR
jgi:Flp pilus assembly protein TadG